MTIEMKMENPPTQKTKKNNPTLLYSTENIKNAIKLS